MNSLFIETLFLEKILVILDKIPGLSKTSNLKYAENILSLIFSNINFSFFDDNEKNFILPLKIDDISEISAEVVADGPAPSP